MLCIEQAETLISPGETSLFPIHAKLHKNLQKIQSVSGFWRCFIVQEWARLSTTSHSTRNASLSTSVSSATNKG